MKTVFWKISAVILVLLFTGSLVSARGFSGWYDLVQSNINEDEDGERISERDTTNHNLYLNFSKDITSLFSYQLNLRATHSDNSVTGRDGNVTSTYDRSLEPALDLFLGNPVYDLRAGYRRQETWDTASISNDGRLSKDFYYSRLNVSPRALPSINIDFDHQESKDHLDESLTDETFTAYSIGSTYTLPTDALIFRYSVHYGLSTDKTPLNSIINKTENENFNGNYTLGYSDSLWADKVNYRIAYKGNYSRSKREQFADVAGSVLRERTPLSGLYGKGDTTNNDVDVLTSESDFIDDDLVTPSAYDIGTGGIANQFHNLGILVSSQQPVDTMYIYVNKDVSGDGVLNSSVNWRVMRSNFNTAGTWIDVPIDVVTITTDSANNEFRYEIRFLAPQSASFYKAINLQNSSLPAVIVTEVEAYGTDSADESVSTSVDTTFNQGLNFNAAYRALPELVFAFDYALDRLDNNPVSIPDSMGGLLENIFSDSVDGDKHDFRSNIIRNYGATTTWYTHQYLTSTLRLHRNESFDNRDEIDTRLDTYSLLFNSAPLPTLDTSLSLIRSETYLFDDKSSTSDSVLLSVGSKLYRDVNMITDVNFIKVESHESGETTTTQQVSGTLDAVLRRDLSGSVAYNLNWTDTEGESFDAQQGSVTLTYRPGRFISLNGNFTITDSNGEVTTTEGLLVDWLPLQAVRFNLNYQHTDADAGPVTIDSVNGYIIWYVTKFADVRFTSGYTTQRADTRLDTYNMNTNINCRF